MGQGKEGIKKEERSHSLQLNDRRQLALTGVEEVLNFNDKLVQVITTKGGLEIKGQDLHIKELDLEAGEMSLDGEIQSLDYQILERRIGFWKRLFK